MQMGSVLQLNLDVYCWGAPIFRPEAEKPGRKKQNKCIHVPSYKLKVYCRTFFETRRAPRFSETLQNLAESSGGNREKGQQVLHSH